MDFNHIAILIVLVLVGMAVRWCIRTLYTIKLHAFNDLYPEEPFNRQGFIYAFRGKTNPWWFVKIGRSNDVFKRMRQHRTASVNGVRIVAICAVPDDVQAETNVHARFSPLRKRGEWFRMSLSMRVYFFFMNNTMLRDVLQDELDRYR